MADFRNAQRHVARSLILLNFIGELFFNLYFLIRLRRQLASCILFTLLRLTQQELELTARQRFLKINLKASPNNNSIGVSAEFSKFLGGEKYFKLPFK